MSFIRPTSARQVDIGLTILRVITGIIFIAHGGQKLFVYGFAGVSGAFAQMGVPMAGVAGPLVALVEFFGGLALVLGLLTRLTSLGLAIIMVGAIGFAHLKNGFFLPTGYEFALTLLGSAVTLLLTGAGAFSLDARLAGRKASTTSAPARKPVGRAA